MAADSNATPLVALDAVIIDTETTGLDPAKAWIVELAAVRLTRGHLDTHAPFRRRIRPGAPIPASATRIHGIDDAAVAAAPAFAEVWSEFSAFVGNAVVIGHALGFDLAVLKRECERAGIVWVRPRSLDTRLLAEVTRAGTSKLRAGRPCRMARRRNHGSPFRPRRRHELRADFSRAIAQIA